MRHFRSHDYSSSRQPNYQVGLGALLLQVLSKHLSRRFARCKHHITSIISFREQINASRNVSFKRNSGPEILHPVTSVPTVSPTTTRRRLWSRNRSKTMIGILLSMQREKAVESITLSCLRNASR